MRLLGGLRASWHYGRALGKFRRGRFGEAVQLLEKVSSLDRSYLEHDLYNSFLGRAHFALGNYAKAAYALERAQDGFRRRGDAELGPFEKGEAIQTAKALSDALRKAADPDGAQE